MSKLNKTEINAIASKALRALNRVRDEKSEKAKANYKPSNLYLKAKALEDTITKKIEEKGALEKEIDALQLQLSKLVDTYAYNWGNVTNRIMNNEIEEIKPVPSFDEIYEDITIGCIDKDFDVDKFIDELIAKHK